jgi:anti-sigma-K factor RskA
VSTTHLETDNATDEAIPPVRRVSPWWRVLSVVLLVALLLAWAASSSMFAQYQAQVRHLQAKLAVLPQVKHVAVLLDTQQQPALLVTFDPGAGALQLQRLNDVMEGREESLQLWALASGKPPRSLGLLTSRYKTLQIPAKADDLVGAEELAVSVEVKGGAADTAGPELPLLFKGWLVQKAI